MRLFVWVALFDYVVKIAFPSFYFIFNNLSVALLNENSFL